MKPFCSCTIMYLLVVVFNGFTVSGIEIIKSFSQDNYCNKKSEHSALQTKLPCFCPKEWYDGQFLKSLCPTIETRKKEIQLIKGENVTFECRVSKKLGPDPHYKIRMWWCNGTAGEKCYTNEQAPDRGTPTYFVYSESGYEAKEWFIRFTITNASKMDENTYTCVANTEDFDYTETPGYNSIHVSVHDAVKPNLIYQPPPKVNKVDGRLVELYCASSGYPETNIQWVKNGTPLTNGLNSTNIIQYGSQSVLQIKSITESEEGTYQCIASNKLDLIESQGTTVTVGKQQQKWSWFICLYIAIMSFSGVVTAIVLVVVCSSRREKEQFDSAVTVDGRRACHSYSPIPQVLLINNV
ncbi:synaptogenesis protein syg-1-like [Antedon mediterranea]|uniref:synaptogenesis protein syg-1-like n=1 Tax=Antedon mediterranea TaxID=105859 RepID=UPI003AF94754